MTRTVSPRVERGRVDLTICFSHWGPPKAVEEWRLKVAEGDGEMRKKTRKTVRKRNDQTASFERRRWLWNFSGFNLLPAVEGVLSKCNIWSKTEG